MPKIGDTFYERWREGPYAGRVDPAFIRYFRFDSNESRWRHGKETRVITWLPLSELAYNLSTAYLYNHPDAESDEVLQFLNDCFTGLTMTLYGSEDDEHDLSRS